MDKNTYTGLFLIMLILFGSFYLMKPNEAEIKKAQIQAHIDSLKKAGIKTNATAKADSITKPKTVDSALLKTAFGAATVGDDKIVTLENAELLLKVSTRGGRVQSAQLKKFKTYDGKPLILFDGANDHFGLNFIAGNRKINTNDLYFKPSANALVASKTDSAITFRLNYSDSQYIDYIYSLSPDGYKLGLVIKEVGLDGVIVDNKNININWQSSMLKTEKDMTMERQYSTITYKNTEDDVYNLNTAADEAKTISDKKVQWVSFKQHFFSNVLIYKDGFTKSDLKVSTDTSNKVEVKQMLASLELPANNAGVYPFEFYFGPNEFKTLKAQGYGLDKQIDLGWALFKWINRYVVLVVFDFLKQFGWSYGIVILILTVLLKLVLSPLTYKSYLSMAKMRVLKPEMDEIKAKVGEDNPTQLQQEYMKLYKKAGVNPLGGCLPMLLQLPIVFAFLRFFPALFELRGQSFLWMKDLSTYDDVIKFGTTIPLLGDHLSLMCLLMTISTFIYTYFNNQISGATGQMKYIGYITPVIFIFVLNKYPAGLNYYYFLANMLTFAQQYLIRLMVDDKKIHAQIQDNKKKPEDKNKKKSGFAAKMEELMRQQQQIAAQKNQPKK